jgi:hypothetical protein
MHLLKQKCHLPYTDFQAVIANWKDRNRPEADVDELSLVSVSVPIPPLARLSAFLVTPFSCEAFVFMEVSPSPIL